jgi:hypothetical protein
LRGVRGTIIACAITHSCRARLCWWEASGPSWRCA